MRLLAVFNLITFVFLPFSFLISEPALAKNKRIIIDAEIHQYLTELANPILNVAKINLEDVKLHILQDNALNAFVAGGKNIFLHTGLLISTETPQQLRGVLAHEIGHIAGGHLTRMSQAYREASNFASLGSILGLAAAIASGQPQAAPTLVHGAGSIAQKTFLRHTRGQEAAADQAAARYLIAIREGPGGLLDFLRILKEKEAVSSDTIPLYLRTHPLTKDRIKFFEKPTSVPNDIKKRTALGLIERHKKMIAKLFSFLRPPSETFLRYKKSENSYLSKYAFAIAHHKNAESHKSQKLLNELIATTPMDPYLWELKGQIFFEFAKPRKARSAYQKALSINGNIPLIRQQLTRVELAINSPETISSALKNAKIAARALPKSALSWHNLAVAQGRNGNIAMANLSLAELALLQNNMHKATLHANRAKKVLKENTPAYQRSLDIINTSKKTKKNQR